MGYQGLVNVPIKHHPTIGNVESPTDICFGDVKQIPKKGHLHQPLPWIYLDIVDYKIYPTKSH